MGESSKESRATRFIDACYGRPTDCTPVWMMRQAGRYQPSYRALRKQVKFFELCRNPELAAQVTLVAAEELNADAAIIFSDILVPVQGMGLPVELTEKGPVLARPLDGNRDIEQLRVLEPENDVPFVLEAVRQTCAGLDGQIPLIGFVGAPLTLASYMVEGGHSKNFAKLKQLLYSDGKAAHQLMDKITSSISRHLRAQAQAGCRALQIFDSWAGILGPSDYREFCFPYISRVIEETADLNVPRIIFGTSTATLLDQFRDCGAEVVGIDWRVPLSQAREIIGPDRALQGNLDPCALLAPQDELERRVRAVLKQAGDAPGYIFNLGHGILPPTPPENARFVFDLVHRLTQRS